MRALYSAFVYPRRHGVRLLLLAALLLTLCASSPARADGDNLGARVRFAGSQFVITNSDSFDWVDCELQINAGMISDGYKLEVARLSTGATYTVGVMQFAKSGGERFNPFSHKLERFAIYCDTPTGLRYWAASLD